MERNDRSNQERMRNQDDPHEQGTQSDNDKMSEREVPDPPNIERGEEAVRGQKPPHVRTEDEEQKRSER